MNLVDYFRRNNLKESDLWKNFDWLYEQLLLRYSDKKKFSLDTLNLYNISFNLLIQLRRVAEETRTKRGILNLPETLDEWLRINDTLYNEWLSTINGNDQVDSLPDGVPTTISKDWNFVATRKDPSSFPRDSAMHRDWKVFSEGVQVIEKRLSNVEADRRNVLLQCRELSRKIEQLNRLNFVQNRLSDTFERLVSPEATR